MLRNKAHVSVVFDVNRLLLIGSLMCASKAYCSPKTGNNLKQTNIGGGSAACGRGHLSTLRVAMVSASCLILRGGVGRIAKRADKLRTSLGVLENILPSSCRPTLRVQTTSSAWETHQWRSGASPPTSRDGFPGGKRLFGLPQNTVLRTTSQ